MTNNKSSIDRTTEQETAHTAHLLAIAQDPLKALHSDAETPKETKTDLRRGLLR